MTACVMATIDQVSLDCNDPDGAVFTCVAANRAAARQQGASAASAQEAAPQLPYPTSYPWEQLVDQSACWSKVTPRLEGGSAPSPRAACLKAQGAPPHASVQPRLLHCSTAPEGAT